MVQYIHPRECRFDKKNYKYTKRVKNRVLTPQNTLIPKFLTRIPFPNGQKIQARGRTERGRQTMDKIIVNGGNTLHGTVAIGGMKNSALPIISACLLTKETCILDNIPLVSDIRLLLEILSAVGAEIKLLSNTSVQINCKNVTPCSSPDDLACQLRGSSYLLGAELGRFGEASVALPGGCKIGARPLDLHMKAFEALGANCSIFGGHLNVEAVSTLKGNTIFFDKVSVGATVNAILASVYAEGTTIIENAAREPHIVDLAAFLNACGANITGAGTSVIKVRGVKELRGCRYSIAPDMIEAGTYMVAAATVGGRVTVTNIIPKHLESVTNKLIEAGVSVTVGDSYITVESNGKYNAVNITTQPYPGFPTDMQAQFSTMLAYANGTSRVTENIFTGRFQFADELTKTGAQISVESNTAVIKGVQKTGGAPLTCHDLRAGAAMVIAALRSEGTSEITKIELIERGYVELVEKFASLGADIKRVNAVTLSNTFATN